MTPVAVEKEVHQHGSVPARVIGVPFKKGYDSRRSIARNPAETFKEAWARLVAIDDKTGEARYPLDKLEELIDNPKTAHPVAQAALVIVQGRAKGHHNAKMLCSEAQDRMFDRWLGKPTQQIQLEATVTTLAEAEGDLIAIFRADPALLPRILSRLTEQLPGLRESILAELGEPAVLALPAPTGE